MSSEIEPNGPVATADPPRPEGDPTPAVAKGRVRPNVSGGRESVESFVFVFLFFLVLGVEAEGFVIPTGSMAPTLMGRHKEITCPECGDVYAVNADREVSEHGKPPRIAFGTCVNCRYTARVADEPSFPGDRIYVMKTPLDIPFLPSLGKATLNRWDVTVFKLPEEPEVRYIKRLVGIGGEVVRILRGDIWVRPLEGDRPFRRAPRPLKHQEGMQILVHDDAHRPRSLKSDRRWTRWSGDSWDETGDSPGTYRTSSKVDANDPDGWAELRYTHMVPDPVQWAAVIDGKPLPHPPRATLITDFYAYNTDVAGNDRISDKAWRQPHWVGDLTVKFRLDVEGPKGSIRVELVKAGIPNRCEIDLATGLATLRHGDQVVGTPTPTGLNTRGKHEVSFANVDDRLTLKVDGRLPFGEGVELGVRLGEPVAPTAADLSPAAVATKGSSVSVSGLVLTRDIYYTLKPSTPDYDRLSLDEPLPTDPVAFFDWLADPRQFGAFGRLLPYDYPIAPHRTMMLGDNSPWSRDGRQWGRGDQRSPDDDPSIGWDESGRESWEVPESLLIGKAFSVYWPHMKPVWPAIRLSPDVEVPCVPNFWEMRWIR